MIKIIKGKKYNTETAKKLDYYQHSNPGDFCHFRETLYQKKTKEFFLHGAGGAASRYNNTENGTSYASEMIIPMFESEAKTWAEENLTGEEYIEIFGDVTE